MQRASMLPASAWPAAVLLALALLPAGLARAQAVGPAQASVPQQGAQPHRHLPIITGSVTGRMDAPETNSDLEQYTHSAMVKSLARHLGLSTSQASRYFEDLNSGILIAVILFFLFRIVPGKFRAKREGLVRDLGEARETTADAQKRLTAIEDRLAAIGNEVDALRRQSQESMKGEEARIQASMEEERRRILRSAEAEIEAAQASAERGLRRFAANLAIERAAAQVELDPDSEQRLMNEFLEGLAAEPGLRGRN